MERFERGPFQLYRRKTKQKKNGQPVHKYYYRVWTGNTRSAGKSTGMTSKTAARSYTTEKRENVSSSVLPFSETQGA